MAKPDFRHVAVVEEGPTSVAVEIARKGTRWCVVESNDTPRIFVAFPLTATRDFCLPVIINNESLQPREDRDTIFLKENREGNPNLSVIEGVRSRRTPCGYSPRRKVGTAPPRCREWVNCDSRTGWTKRGFDPAAKRFIEPLRQTKIMPTLGDHENPPAGGHLMRTPAEGLIPLPSDAATCHDVWDMMAQLPDESAKAAPPR